jgi:hypothetical protein
MKCGKQVKGKMSKPTLTRSILEAGSASVREVLAIIAPMTGIGHFSKQNLYLFLLRRCQINWLVWGEDEGQYLLYS